MTDKAPTSIVSSPRTDSPATRPFASSSSFFSVKPKVVTEDVHFPEKNQWLRFKALSQAEYATALAFCITYDQRTRQRTPEDDKDLNIAYFIMGAVDQDGNHVFDFKDYPLLEKEPYAVVNRGAAVVVKMSGINEDPTRKQKRQQLFGVTDEGDES